MLPVQMKKLAEMIATMQPECGLPAYDQAWFSNVYQYCKNYYELICRIVSILDSFVPEEVAGKGGCNLIVSHDAERRVISIFYGEIIEEEHESIVESVEENCALQGVMSEDEKCAEVSQNVANEVIGENIDPQPNPITDPSHEVIEWLERDDFKNDSVIETNTLEDDENLSNSIEDFVDSASSRAGDFPHSLSKSPKYICQYVDCSRVFYVAREYSVHQEACHHMLKDNSVAVRCKYINCKKEFNNIRLLRAHHTAHQSKGRAPNTYSDSGTSVGTTSQESVSQKISGQKEPVRVRRCGFCDTILNAKLDEYRKHCLEVHNLSPFGCSMCTDSFHLQSHLAEHMTSEHPLVEVEKFIMKNLWREFITHQGVKMAECGYCYRVFHSKKSRETHAKQHRKELRVSCDRCGGNHCTSFCSAPKPKYYSTLGKLHCILCNRWMPKNKFKEHMETHTMDRQFPCTVCKKTFKAQRTATRHIQNHLNASNRKRKCYHCPTVFANEEDVPEHYRTQHPMLRPYCCPVCGEGFYGKAPLTDHCHAHTSEERRSVSIGMPVDSYQVGRARVYECTLCRRSFSSKRSTLAHFTVHMDRPFVCSTCNLSFRVENMLSMHMEEVHQMPNVAKPLELVKN